ncbi:MAG: hypothetical protein WC816_03265 [Sphingomonas sp.]
MAIHLPRMPTQHVNQQRRHDRGDRSDDHPRFCIISPANRHCRWSQVYDNADNQQRHQRPAVETKARQNNGRERNPSQNRDTDDTAQTQQGDRIRRPGCSSIRRQKHWQIREQSAFERLEVHTCEPPLPLAPQPADGAAIINIFSFQAESARTARLPRTTTDPRSGPTPINVTPLFSASCAARPSLPDHIGTRSIRPDSGG